MPRGSWPRVADIARKAVRVDMSSIPPATAVRLLAEYEPLVRRIASTFPTLEAEELHAVGRVAVMEAWVTHNPQRIPLRAWIRQVIRWRIVDRADGELSRLDQATLELAPEPDTNGRHDPERLFMLDQIIELLVYLPPRQAMIIDARLRRETFAEVATSLGLSQSTCHAEYLNALAQLRKWLGFKIC